MSDEKPQGNPKVKSVHMAIGLDLIGSKTSLDYSKYDIEATAIGIKAQSRNTGRTIIIPYSNCKGFELMPEGGMGSIKAPAQARADQAMREARADEAKRGLAAKAQAQSLLESIPNLTEEEQLEQAQAARRLAKEKKRMADEQALKEEQSKTARLSK
jgi:hypothetical protein